nr:hypothetical protein CFP56_70559 [Quercus suber]
MHYYGGMNRLSPRLWTYTWIKPKDLRCSSWPDDITSTRELAAMALPQPGNRVKDFATVTAVGPHTSSSPRWVAVDGARPMIVEGGGCSLSTARRSPRDRR